MTTYIADGPVSNANCVAYSNNIQVAQGTSNNGLVTFTLIPAYDNTWMTVTCYGGTYTDEATGNTVTLPSTTYQRATFCYTGGLATVTVTPLTEIAYEMTINESGTFEDYYLNQGIPRCLHRGVTSLSFLDTSQLAAA